MEQERLSCLYVQRMAGWQKYYCNRFIACLLSLRDPAIENNARSDNVGRHLRQPGSNAGHEQQAEQYPEEHEDRRRN